MEQNTEWDEELYKGMEEYRMECEKKNKGEYGTDAELK